ncbi:toll/interleukin-1 receptor domain-containing protein [Amycolatopsis sp. NBC_00345]|uniref:toll/interleukin-1 receptor domain-containing protein n=1 Tax=Amycolatopsis sp. NBC_00345 TaxID=2975955 RepID=UPI002E258E1E
MPQSAEHRATGRPRVFLSFAGPDRPAAKQLREDLRLLGIDAFVDDTSIEPGRDFVLALNTALAESDYYVLLWSRHTVDRPWVDLEWSAAFVQDLSAARRSFLFIVRLDDAELPPLLAPRKYLDAYPDWAAMVSRLVTAWRQDLAVGTPVLPAPGPRCAAGPQIRLYVRNQALSVAHQVPVPVGATGAQLMAEVRSALELEDAETRFGGKVGLRFEYELHHRGLPVSDRPLSELGITEDSVLDLTVTMEPFGPDGTGSPIVYRAARPSSAVLAPAMLGALLKSAFGHLEPRGR